VPGYVLHVGATVLCFHFGQAQPTAPNPRVKVNGQPVVMQTCLYTIAGCTLPAPPTANGPCVSAQFLTAATRVRAASVPVLLQDSQALCAPSGTGLNIVQIQLRVKAM
jgi:hypothetical protein